MKKLFIFLSLILMVGCTTFKPVSTMDNWQLRSEYSEYRYDLLPGSLMKS